MLKEAEEQRLEALAAAGRYVSYNMCATWIMCAESSFNNMCEAANKCADFILTNGLPP